MSQPVRVIRIPEMFNAVIQDNIQKGVKAEEWKIPISEVLASTQSKVYRVCSHPFSTPLHSLPPENLTLICLSMNLPRSRIDSFFFLSGWSPAPFPGAAAITTQLNWVWKNGSSNKEDGKVAMTKKIQLYCNLLKVRNRGRLCYNHHLMEVTLRLQKP